MLGSGAARFVFVPHLPVIEDGDATAAAARLVASAASIPGTPLDAAAALYHCVFPDGESDSALRMCHELSAADKHALSAQGIDDQRALIYGEIRFFAFARCLELAMSLLPAERRASPTFFGAHYVLGYF